MEDPDIVDTPYREGVRGLYHRCGITPPPAAQVFLCPSLAECSRAAHTEAYHTGTWLYIGTEYGAARITGRPARILFVAMERGGKFNPLEEPTFADTHWNFRQSMLDYGNPHMAGVSMILQRLVDDPDPFVFCHQFALTNAVKCVRFTGNMRSTSTGTMMRNCARHLREEIQLLQPHLLITQGSHPRDTILALFSPTIRVAAFPADWPRAQIFLTPNFVLLTTPHPARCPGWRFSAGIVPEFLQDAVVRARGEMYAFLNKVAG